MVRQGQYKYDCKTNTWLEKFTKITLERSEKAAMAEAAPAWTTGDGCLRSDHKSLAASIVSKSSKASTSAVKLAIVSAAADNNPGWFPDNNQTKRGTARSVRSKAKFSWSVPITEILLTIGKRTC